MEEQVRAVDGDVRGLRGDDPRLIFNVRFHRRDAELYDPPVPVLGNDFIRKIRRYALVATGRAPAGLDAQWAHRVAATKDRPTGKVRRKGTPASEMDLAHHAMQNELARALRRKYGYKAVKVEEDFIDIQVRDGKRLLFLEVKPDPRPRRAIREALGQLLEYEFVAAKSGRAPTELIVVGPGEPSSQELAYLRHLRTRWAIPIKYVPTSEGGDLEI
jgi:hypothetical protein